MGEYGYITAHFMTTGFLSFQTGKNNYNRENCLPVLVINKCTKPKHRKL